MKTVSAIPIIAGWLGLAIAAHATSYTIMTGTNGSGTVSCNPTNASYPNGVTVTVTATPAAGWYFSGWSGSITNAVNPTNVTVNANLVIDATFLPDATNTLSLVTNGSGTIALSPAGGSYASNTTVTATATPAAGWVFAGWSGAATGTTDPLAIVLDTNETLTGTFAELPAFTTQPQSVTNVVGSTVTFTSAAIGTASVNYQWYFSGGSLPGATNNNLSLTNAQLSQAGTYWAIITNLYGGTTSSIVTLDLTNMSGSTNVVNSLTDSALRTAIAAGGWVSFGVNGTISLTNSITITGNVILDGTGVNVVISGGGSNRIFYVQSGTTLSVTNLVLANGLVGSTNSTPADGGAIYNNGGTLALTACLLTNNCATNNTANAVARGGVIFNNGGVVGVYGSSLSNNAVGNGVQNNDTTALAAGGAIYNTNGTVTVNNSILSSNECLCAAANAPVNGPPNAFSFGGAVFQASGSLCLSNCQLSANLAYGNDGTGDNAGAGYGGGVAAQAGTLILDHSRLTQNLAHGGDYNFNGAPGAGGAIWSAATLTVESCTIASNSTSGGVMNRGTSTLYTALALGGGFCNSGSAAVDRSSIYANTLTGANAAGGTYYDDGANAFGGGCYNAGWLAVTNSTIALNTVTGGNPNSGSQSGAGPAKPGDALGGGLYNTTNATFIGMNLTLASNLCTAGSGGVAAGGQIATLNAGSASVQLHNCLIASGGANGNCSGTITDIGFNLNSDGTATFSSGSSYNNTNPQLDPLANYGGPTLCLALAASSPAIGNGDTNGAPATDQRDYYRFFANGMDIGAYQFDGREYEYTTVTNATDAALRTAIAAGGWVNFSVNGMIALTNSITIAGNVILDGTGVNVVISGGGSNRIFYVQSGASLAATNLVLANGYAGSTTTAPADGGAIYNNGMVMLTDCVLTNNLADDGYNGSKVSLGGAIFNNGGTVGLYGSSLSNNAAVNPQNSSIGNSSLAGGGAVYTTNGTLTVANCILSSNRCAAGVAQANGSNSNLCYGGAILQASGSTLITNTLLAANTAIGTTLYGTGELAASGYGGAVAAPAGTLVISGSQLLGNTAVGGSVFQGGGGTGQGGAVWSGGSLALQGSTVASNSATAGGCDSGASAAQGGGIYSAGSAAFSQSVLFNNTVTGGGGIGEFGTVGGGNAYGGGLYNGGTGTATNCTFALNSTAGGQPGIGTENQPGNMGNSAGGGLFNAGTGTLVAMNDTFASNSCLDLESYPTFDVVTVLAGAQIANTNGTVQLHNCLIAYGGTNANCYGFLTDVGFNMNSDGTATFTSGSSYNNTNPLLDPLANYGGPTLSMDLLGSSPAIGNGDTSGAPAVDQRGYYRIFAEGVDIGAVQYAGTTNVPAAILTQPASTTAPAGGSASFSVGVAGAAPFTYQWQQNGTNLPGATAATLTLTNLSLSQSGYYYSVTVSNAVNAVQSGTAWLTVTGPALAINVTGTNSLLGFTALSSKTYDLLVSSNLTTWTTQQVIGPFGTTSNFTLPLGSLTNGSRFYRLWQP